MENFSSDETLLISDELRVYSWQNFYLFSSTHSKTCREVNAPCRNVYCLCALLALGRRFAAMKRVECADCNVL